MTTIQQDAATLTKRQKDRLLDLTSGYLVGLRGCETRTKTVARIAKLIGNQARAGRLFDCLVKRPAPGAR